MLRSLSVRLVGACILLIAQIVTAVRAVWDGLDPVPGQRIYFANHTSNGDFVLIWTVLPPALRMQTRPVAAADYWLTSRLRAFIGRDVFRAVLIDRNPDTRTKDPVAQMIDAVDGGDSLILFPEGTRNITPERLLPFKPGLFHLASARPDIDLVPVWISNLNNVMPKGEVVPIPLLCTICFGKPIRLERDEPKDAFLQRASVALLALAPDEET